jgi:hypothetical protein
MFSFEFVQLSGMKIWNPACDQVRPPASCGDVEVSADHEIANEQ